MPDGGTHHPPASSSDVVVELMSDEDRAECRMWSPVVRFFIGGPLNGRAIEGPDSREWELGPNMGTADWWHDGWVLYSPSVERSGELSEWIVYELQPEELLRRARRKYVAGELVLEAFELAVDWALSAEKFAAESVRQHL